MMRDFILLSLKDKYALHNVNYIIYITQLTDFFRHSILGPTHRLNLVQHIHAWVMGHCARKTNAASFFPPLLGQLSHPDWQNTQEKLVKCVKNSSRIACRTKASWCETRCRTFGFGFSRTVSRIHVANLFLVTAVTPWWLTVTDIIMPTETMTMRWKSAKEQMSPFLGFSRFCFLILQITWCNI